MSDGASATERTAGSLSYCLESSQENQLYRKEKQTCPGEATKVSSLFVIATEHSLTLTMDPNFWTKEEFSGKFC